MRGSFDLSVTTQGPLYPPSEVMDENGDFVVVGYLPEQTPDGKMRRRWGSAIVSKDTPVPPFGEFEPYKIARPLCLDDGANDFVLQTLPVPLVANNYPMVFAPAQVRRSVEARASRPLHDAYIPDARPEDGRKITNPITFKQWCRATGTVHISLTADRRDADFEFEMAGLIPDSLYTVMALREHDLNPQNPTRPGPLGIPNAFIADAAGKGSYKARMPHPFPADGANRNRIINVIVLWMSTQMTYGGAIGYYGLGGDIHAQLKLKKNMFDHFVTTG